MSITITISETGKRSRVIYTDELAYIGCVFECTTTRKVASLNSLVMISESELEKIRQGYKDRILAERTITRLEAELRACRCRLNNFNVDFR